MKRHSYLTSQGGKGEASSSGPTALNLLCSFTIEPNGQTLDVKLKIVNAGGSDVFVLDRIWHMDSSGKQVADPENIYRFVRGPELRLLWGLAPVPRLKTVTYRNIPYASLVKPGGSHEINQKIPVPVKEYSIYFPETSKDNPKLQAVTRIAAIVQFVEPGSNLAISAAPFDPSAFKIPTATVLETVKNATCSSPLKVDALRRTDQFDRFNMPNEPPEPIVLPQQ